MRVAGFLPTLHAVRNRGGDEFLVDEDQSLWTYFEKWLNTATNR
jgi:hypothetical protein